MDKYKIKLTKEEVSDLRDIVKKCPHSTQTYRATYILLNVNEVDFSLGKVTNERICEVLKISMCTIDRVKKKLIQGGIDMALKRDKGNRIYEKKINGDIEAKLKAISCCKPPKGYAKWSFRMLADKMVELQYVDSISHVSIEKGQKKTNLNRGK